jgi:hypothetical protein
MKNFFDWLKENNLELPILDTPEAEHTTDEQRARTGWSANYPPAYFSAQYPSNWMQPRKSTAALDGEIMGKKKK